MGCPNGSAPQAGAPAIINLGQEEAKGLLGSAWSWIGQYIPFLGTTSIATADLCRTDAPACNLTATDLFGLITPPLGTGVVIEKLKACVLQQAWPSYCQCNSAPASCSACYNDALGLEPLHYYILNDAAGGSQVLDSVTGTLDANLYNGDVLGVASNWAACTALHCNGQAGNYCIDTPMGFTAGAWSWAMWMKTSSTGTRYLWYWGASGSTSGAYIALVGNSLDIAIFRTGGGISEYTGTHTLNDGNWHHVVVTYDGTTLKGYLDGALECSGASTPPTAQARMNVGAQFNSSQALIPDLYVSQVGVYDRALTSAEVTNLYNACKGNAFVPPPAPEPTLPSGAPTTPAFTCSTTGDICGKLFEIDNRLLQVQNLTQWLTGIQTSGGFVQGTPVTGLAGAGTIAQTGLLGALVNVTTIPLKWGYTSEMPKRYIPAIGSIRAGNDLAFGDWTAVHYADLLYLPNLQLGSLNKLHYWFPTGIVATITPLLATK